MVKEDSEDNEDEQWFRRGTVEEQEDLEDKRELERIEREAKADKWNKYFEEKIEEYMQDEADHKEEYWYREAMIEDYSDEQEEKEEEEEEDNKGWETYITHKIEPHHTTPPQ